jgi:maleate isomerase
MTNVVTNLVTDYPLALTTNSGREIVFDKGRHYRGKVGFVLLAMEQTMESDIFNLTPPGVGIHIARAPMDNVVSVETLQAMTEGIGDAASTILPDLDLDVIAYGCTSGSVVIGEDKVFAQLRRGAPNAKTTSLITSVMNALNALDITRIAVATPYLHEVNVIERDYMQERGFEILNIEGLGLAKDEDMARVAPSYIAEFAASVDRPDTEALFISCGALRSVEVIDQLEQKLQKPVITSNQALVWDCLRQAGITDQFDGYGTLFHNY